MIEADKRERDERGERERDKIAKWRYLPFSAKIFWPRIHRQTSLSTILEPIMADVKPNHTIYVNNLNEKIKKDGK